MVDAVDGVVDGAAVDDDAPAIEGHQASQTAKGKGLSGTGRPEERYHTFGGLPLGVEGEARKTPEHLD